MWLVTCCISCSPWIARKLPSFHTYKKRTTSSLFKETSNKVTLNHEAESHVKPLGFSIILWSLTNWSYLHLVGIWKRYTPEDHRWWKAVNKLCQDIWNVVYHHFFHVKKCQLWILRPEDGDAFCGSFRNFVMGTFTRCKEEVHQRCYK